MFLPIYLDNAATTRVSDKAAAEALRVMTECYGNPSSVHDFGHEASLLLEESRKSLLRHLGSSDRGDDFIFTSGGTESNNLAVFGSLSARRRNGKSVFISDSEHASMQKIAHKLTALGYTVRTIPTKGGTLDLDFCAAAFSSDTVLISCMAANNETGALYDIAALDRLRKEFCPEAILHTDCVQAFLKTDRPLCSLTKADLISVSGHKVHAPKGIGGLYIKKGIPVAGIVCGGGQEKDIRPGTEPLPNIAAFAAAVNESDLSENRRKVSDLSVYLREKIEQETPEIRRIVPASSLPYVNGLILPDIKSEVMLRHLSSDGICVSAGSACSSKHKENRVLTAFGLTDHEADCTIRVSFSEYNTTSDIDRLIESLKVGLSSLIRIH